MIISMTGFYSKTKRIELTTKQIVALTIEIKTLNSRFFEIVTKVPYSLNNLELSISTLLQSKLIRGRVYLNINFDKTDATLEQISPSIIAVEQYLSAVKILKSKFKLEGSLSLTDIMHLPNTFVAKNQQLAPEDDKKILEFVTNVTDSVIEVRKQEGNRLAKDLNNIFKTCAEKINTISATFQVELEKLKKSITEMMIEEPTNLQQNSHIEEIQLTLKKIDIHEEIIRFKSHLDALILFLNTPVLEKGKRLDFILQELLRETNTMMAKCSAFQISNACIDIKIELEKAREQIQNIV